MCYLGRAVTSKGGRGQKAERNKSIILLRLTPDAEPAAVGAGEADRGGVRWMNTSSYYFESSERNKIKILLRLGCIYAILLITKQSGGLS